MRKTLLLVLALAASAWAQAPAWTVPQVRAELQRRYHVPEGGFSPTGLRLSELVRMERQSFSGAVVTSGFYDLRGLSRYRSRPGLHLGYDVAMPRGAVVLAAWPGRVTAITPWTNTEYGVTIQHPDGSQVTYGHVAPKVKVGQAVTAGQALATIEIDHVDVKMRDASGAPFDFGDGPAPAPAAPERALSKNELLARWVVYRGEWQSTLDELKTAGRSLVDPEWQRAHLKTRIAQLEKKSRQMPDFLAQGLVAQRDVDLVQQELAAARREARLLASRAGEAPARVKSLGQARDAAARRLLQTRKQAAARGLKWEDAEALAEGLVARDPKLQKIVASSPARPEDTGAQELSAQVKRSGANLKRLEELYAAGGLSKAELDEARAEQRLLAAEEQVLKRLLK